MKTPLVVGNIDRQKYIGGSDVAAILGISPWKTALDVYLDKTTPRKEETDPGKQRVFNRGKRMEQYVIDLLAEELRLAQQALGEITGEFTPDDLLGVIFSRFCIGK